MYTYTFGEQLRKYLRNTKTSQTALAQKSGLSKGYISEILGDLKTPSVTTIEKIAKGLELDKPEKDTLLRLAGHPVEKQVSLDNHTLRLLFATLSDPQLSDFVKKHIEEDVATIITAWQTYADVEQNRYNQDWEKGIESCDSVKEQVRQSARYLVNYLEDSQAMAYLQLGKLRESEDLLNSLEVDLRALDLSQLEGRTDQRGTATRGRGHQKALIFVHQGDIYRDRGKFEDAIKKYELAEEQFQRLGMSQEETWVQRKKALAHMFKGELWEAQSTLEKCREEFTHYQNVVELIKTNYSLGWAYNWIGVWEKAEEFHRTGIELAQNHRENNPSEADYLLMMGLTHLGYDYLQKDRYPDARGVLTEALKLSETLNQHRERGWIILVLAKLAYLEGRKYQISDNQSQATKCFSEADGRYQESIKTHKATGHRFRLAATYIQYAKLKLRAYNDIDSAETMLYNGRAIAEEIKSEYYVCKAILYLCEVFLQKGNKTTEIDRLCNRLDSEPAVRNSKYLNMHLWIIKSLVKLHERHFEEAAELFTEAFYRAIDFHPYTINGVKKHIRQHISDTYLFNNSDVLHFFNLLVEHLNQRTEDFRLMKTERRDAHQELLRNISYFTESLRKIPLKNAFDRYKF